MKKFIIACLVLSLGLMTNSVQAQLTAKVYKSPDCDRLVSKHEIIAILPMNVTMTDTKANRKNRVPQEELDKKAAEYQVAFQNSMFSWFLRRKQRGRMIDVKIQDVDKTNTILKRAGINSSEDLGNYTKDELANMLGVDAVFSGTVVTSSSFSQGAAVGLAIITGIAVKTGDSDVYIKLYDKGGEMIWSFDRRVSSSYANTTDDMVNFLMKRVSKRFPYEN